MFRWKKAQDGAWIGASGSFGFHIRERIEGETLVLEVESNATAHDFSRLFRLDADPEDVVLSATHTFASIGEVFERQRGLRLLRPLDPVEVIFSFLCSANNNLPRIESMVNFLAGLGDAIPGMETLELRAFPNPARLAELTPNVLRAAKFGYRAERLVQVAKVLAVTNLETLARLSTSDLRSELMTWPGVGPKVADCILLYAFDRIDVVPFDVHMWRAYGLHVQPESMGLSLTEKRRNDATQVMVQRFGNYAGWAHLWLFYDVMSSARGPK